MVKVSHARCRRCGQTRHRNARWNLCGSCWKQEKEHKQAAWRDIKGRRAAKRAEAIQPQEVSVPLTLVEAAEEIHIVPNGTVGRAPRTKLTPEQKQEIVDLYMNTDTPVREIASTYGVPETAPFRILGEFGIAWRRGDRVPESRPGPKRELPPHIAAMQEVHVAPEPQKSRPSVPASGPPPDPERVVPVNLDAPDPINLDAVLADLSDLPLWHIEYSGTLEIRAENFDAAVSAVRNLDWKADITLVRKVG